MEEAALWLVKMSSDECTEEDAMAYQAWQKEDPERAACIEALQMTLGHFAHLKQQENSKPIVSALNAAAHQTEKSLWLLRSVILFASTALIAVMTWHILPANEWLADTRNPYDQWQNQQLSDQSEIKISGETAYDIQFNQHKRVIQLYKGNILVEVAKDASRPFIIETESAKITALGTRFIVHQYENATLLTMLESKAKVEIQRGAQGTALPDEIIEAGQQVLIAEGRGIIYRSNISPELFETAWQQKMLVVQNMPLPEVLGILKSYHRQKIAFDEQALSSIQVTAALPLEHSALELLESSLPVQIHENIFGSLNVVKK